MGADIAKEHPMATIALQPEEYAPAGPPAAVARRYGIAVVGCGTIVRMAHLPAYRTCGYRVVGVCDVAEAAARATAAEFDIPFWTTDIDELLARPDVDVIDLAVHASQRRPLVEKIAAAGKHILSQKPFALSFDDAQHMCAVCGDAGVTLMVNQQARWAPAHRALKLLVERGVLGRLTSVLNVNRSFQDIPGSWFVAMEHFNILDHGIHYIDLARYFTGQTPRRIKATTATMPGQVAVSPMMYSILCEYAPEAQLMATLHFNNIVQTPAAHQYTWWLDGTEGSASATHSELTIALKDRPDERQVIKLHGSWFPDAFGAAMGELLRALAEGRPPLTSGVDNLDTLRMANAAVESAATGRAIELAAGR
jgi:predicted dehydrogenase